RHGRAPRPAVIGRSIHEHRGNREARGRKERDGGDQPYAMDRVIRDGRVANPFKWATYRAGGECQAEQETRWAQRQAAVTRSHEPDVGRPATEEPANLEGADYCAPKRERVGLDLRRMLARRVGKWIRTDLRQRHTCVRRSGAKERYRGRDDEADSSTAQDRSASSHGCNLCPRLADA